MGGAEWTRFGVGIPIVSTADPRVNSLVIEGNFDLLNIGLFGTSITSANIMALGTFCYLMYKFYDDIQKARRARRKENDE